MKIIFMGTPDFAAPALKSLIASKHEVVSIYTQPPRPAGRGYNLKKSPIHELAEKSSIQVRTPVTLKKKEEQKRFAEFKADVAVVAAYSLLLPQKILSACPHGCINIHPSLLPRWRGAAPIQRAIMAGDTETGVCIMQMDSGLDTGDILLQEKIAIPPDWNAGQLHDKLADIGAELLLSALNRIELNAITRRPQSKEGVTYAGKISKDEGKIEWGLPALQVYNQIRGLSPWPGTYFSYKGEKIRILQAEFQPGEKNDEPGKVLDNRLTIACAEGTIRPTLLQRPGKNVLQTDIFLRGYNIPEGTML